YGIPTPEWLRCSPAQVSDGWRGIGNAAELARTVMEDAPNGPRRGHHDWKWAWRCSRCGYRDGQETGQCSESCHNSSDISGHVLSPCAVERSDEISTLSTDVKDRWPGWAWQRGKPGSASREVTR